MKENNKYHHPDALAAATEERRLQFEAVLHFDSQEYEIGDHVIWQSIVDGVEGRGELILIGQKLEVPDGDQSGKFNWNGGQYVQLYIIESRVQQPKRKSRRIVEKSIPSVPEKYAPGKCIELKKNQVIGRTRRRVA